MMTDDPAEADRLAEELDALNTERRAAEQQLVKAAQAQAAGHDFIGEKALIVRGRDWHVGVIGLAAGRLCQQYYCPTCVLSEHEGLLHGSLRSIPGVHIHECLKTCDDLLLRYGGHEQAAGVTLEAEAAALLAYSLLWQQVLRRMPLNFAYSNKGVCTLWTALFGLAFFGEQMTFGKAAGLAAVLAGVALVVTDHE